MRWKEVSKATQALEIGPEEARAALNLLKMNADAKETAWCNLRFNPKDRGRGQGAQGFNLDIRISLRSLEVRISCEPRS